MIVWDLGSEKKSFLEGKKFDRSINGHFDEVMCMAVSPNGKFLVSGGKDRIIRIWDLHNQKQIQTFMGHRDTITSVQFDQHND